MAITTVCYTLAPEELHSVLTNIDDAFALTDKDVFANTGIKRGHVNRYIYGDAVVDAANLFRLTRVLGVDPGQIAPSLIDHSLVKEVVILRSLIESLCERIDSNLSDAYIELRSEAKLALSNHPYTYLIDESRSAFLDRSSKVPEIISKYESLTQVQLQNRRTEALNRIWDDAQLTRSLTIGRLSRASGIREGMLLAILRGEITLTLADAVKLCRPLGCSVSDVFEEFRSFRLEIYHDYLVDILFRLSDLLGYESDHVPYHATPLHKNDYLFWPWREPLGKKLRKISSEHGYSKDPAPIEDSEMSLPLHTNVLNKLCIAMEIDIENVSEAFHIYLGSGRVRRRDLVEILKVVEKYLEADSGPHYSEMHLPLHTDILNKLCSAMEIDIENVSERFRIYLGSVKVMRHDLVEILKVVEKYLEADSGD